MSAAGRLETNSWKPPAGTVQDTGSMGIKTHRRLPVSVPTPGPTLATQACPLFIAGTQNYYQRAFGTESGEEVFARACRWAA